MFPLNLAFTPSKRLQCQVLINQSNKKLQNAYRKKTDLVYFDAEKKIKSTITGTQDPRSQKNQISIY